MKRAASVLGFLHAQRLDRVLALFLVGNFPHFARLIPDERGEEGDDAEDGGTAE